MLNIYAVQWCPHCRKTVEFLKEHEIEFEYHDMEEQSKDVEKKIIEVNGGDDWVVPTMEYDGKWRPGKTFDPEELEQDLRDMGVIA